MCIYLYVRIYMWMYICIVVFVNELVFICLKKMIHLNWEKRWKLLENAMKCWWKCPTNKKALLAEELSLFCCTIFRWQGRGWMGKEAGAGRSIARRSCMAVVVLGWKLLLLPFALFFFPLLCTFVYCWYYYGLVDNGVSVLVGNALRRVKIQKSFEITLYLYKYLPIKPNKSIYKHKWMKRMGK